MKVLLDTHTFLWFIEDDARLSKNASEAILKLNNQRFLSVASLWEIAIKVSIGKMNSHGPFETLVQTQITDNDMQLLPISAKHLDTVQTLPYHHRDPFDRLIVAQALTEDLTLLSHDGNLTDYGVKLLW